jgi:hypothetical protein
MVVFLPLNVVNVEGSSVSCVVHTHTHTPREFGLISSYLTALVKHGNPRALFAST